MRNTPSFLPESGRFGTRALLIALLATAVPATTLAPAQANAQEYRHLNTAEKTRLVKQMEELLLFESELRTGETEVNGKKRKLTDQETQLRRGKITGLRHMISRAGITVITSGMVENLRQELGQSTPETPVQPSAISSTPVIQREAKEDLEIQRADDEAIRRSLHIESTTKDLEDTVQKVEELRQMQRQLEGIENVGKLPQEPVKAPKAQPAPQVMSPAEPDASPVVDVSELLDMLGTEEAPDAKADAPKALPVEPVKAPKVSTPAKLPAAQKPAPSQPSSVDELMDLLD